MGHAAADAVGAGMGFGADQPRIGPNAVTRIAEALKLRFGALACDQVFSAAGLLHHLRKPPTHMVPDEDVAQLHAALARELGPDKARLVGAEAGRLTAAYLLDNRIPKPAQIVLGFLPARLGLKLLLKAIGRHAWTFAGAGTFSYRFGRGLILAIEGGPVCRHRSAESPVCDYYAATFETLFRAIISPRITVSETVCEAQGAQACIFNVALRAMR